MTRLSTQKNPRNLPKNFYEFSMATGYKISTHESIVFIVSKNEHMETEIKKAIPCRFA